VELREFGLRLEGLGSLGVTNSVQSALAHKFGTGLPSPTATTGTVSYATLPAGGTKWTVAFWRSVAAAAFDHYVVTSAGHKWFNGGRADGTATAFLTVTTATGTVKLDAAGSTTDLDDLVILPYEVPAVVAPSIFGYGAAFSQLAYLDCGRRPDRREPCHEELQGLGERHFGSARCPGWLNGVYYQSIRVVDAELEEV
jgi:hypothetical protein